MEADNYDPSSDVDKPPLPVPDLSNVKILSPRKLNNELELFMNGSGDRAVFLCQFHFSGFKLNFKAELNSQIQGFLMRVCDTPSIGRECDSRFRGFGAINHNTVPKIKFPPWSH